MRLTTLATSIWLAVALAAPAIHDPLPQSGAYQLQARQDEEPYEEPYLEHSGPVEQISPELEDDINAVVFNGKKCNSDSDCSSYQLYCNSTSGTCKSKAGDGASCTVNTQCRSGFCVKGQCGPEPGGWLSPCKEDSDCHGERDGEKIKCLEHHSEGKMCMTPEMQRLFNGRSDCKEIGLGCTSDSQCCSGKCKVTEIFFIRQCER